MDYLSQGVFTHLTPRQRDLAGDLPADPVAICAAVAGFIIHPMETGSLSLSADRMAAASIRPVSAILDAMLALDDRPLAQQRDLERRVVGTCRHFAVVSVALLRAKGFAARARCGFATYFRPGKFVDHWVPEWRTGQRWRRLDPEVLQTTKVNDPTDLAGDEFYSGGEAWKLVRAGHADPMQFGVPNDDAAWGPAEIRGNAIRDLASLMKIEMLCWDSWGRMDESYDGKTGPDYDTLIDAVADACANESHETLYPTEDLAVPADLSRF
jgi:hypothetical protein